MPAGVHLQVADRCNHTCQHCYQIQGLKGELGLDEVKAVLDDLAAAGVLTLNVSGGEATLRHDLVEILAYARSRGFAVRLYTNAFLIDDAYAARLAAVGLYEVHVSVYSADPAEHDAVTCVPGSFARTVAGVKALRDHGVRVLLKSPSTSLAEHGAPGVAALAESLGCQHRASANITPREDGALDPLRVAASPSQLVASGLLRPWTPPEDPTAARAAYLATGSCGVGQSGIVVLPNGDVQPCTDTPLRLGNVREDGFAAVLAGEEGALFRRLTWADVHGCRDCDLLPACHRCHATALHEGGDYLGPYASACAKARARLEASVGTVTVLAPDAGCDPGRDPAVGPWRMEGPRALRPIADVRTAHDDALAARHAWLRRAEKSPTAENTLRPVSSLVRPRRGRDTTEPMDARRGGGAAPQEDGGV